MPTTPNAWARAVMRPPQTAPFAVADEEDKAAVQWEEGAYGTPT